MIDLFAERIRELAGDEVGPSIALLLGDPALVVIGSHRSRNGQDDLDVILSIAFEYVRSEPQVATEFFDYFPDRIVFSGRHIPPIVRNLHDTTDLVNAVVKDVWGGLDGVEFQGRRQFMAFLLQRYRWKIHEKQKRATSGKRSEDMQAEVDLDLAMRRSLGDLSASKIVSGKELQARLDQKLKELPDRDRGMIEARRVRLPNTWILWWETTPLAEQQLS